MSTYNTLCLDISTWDLFLDSSGNIAMAQPPYALAQDVASAIKTFLGEVWYDDTIGIPYLAKILGQVPPISVFQQYMVDAAESVPGVVSAVCLISSYSPLTRKVIGQVQFTDESNVTGSISIGPAVTAGISNPSIGQSITTLSGLDIITLSGQNIGALP